VEVLVVLAIAGLILLIVFEAIPSLTRASRNGRRKQDVSVILDAVSSYELKDSDNFPQNCGGGGPACNVCNGSFAQCNAGIPNDYFLYYVQNDLSYYTYTNNLATNDPVVLEADYPQTHLDANPPPNTNPNQVEVYDYEKCNVNGQGGAEYLGADYNDVVALYALEGGNGTVVSQCQQL
jgi:type II secretory pathway pseudopilin PulG